jgi:hypothetical protein
MFGAWHRLGNRRPGGTPAPASIRCCCPTGCHARQRAAFRLRARSAIGDPDRGRTGDIRCPHGIRGTGEAHAIRRTGEARGTRCAREIRGAGCAREASRISVASARAGTRCAGTRPPAVRVSIQNGTITNVTALHLTNLNSYSVAVSSNAAPILRSEVLAAQSARVSSVSGATYTSYGYLTSLQSALDRARF